MRLCYVIPGSLSHTREGREELQRRQAYLAAEALGHPTIEVLDAPDGPRSVESDADAAVAREALLRCLPEVASLGYGAMIVGCFGDPALSAARELVDLPVVGPAQASLHLAAQLGRRVGVLTVNRSVVPLLQRLVRDYGLDRRVGGIRAVEVPVLELRARRVESLERLAREGRNAMGAGADVLVLGCMTMGFLGFAGDLQAILDVPVVNPVTAALHLAESMAAARLRAAPGAGESTPRYWM